MSEQNYDEIEELADDDLLEEEDGPGAEPRANRTLKLDRSELRRAQTLAGLGLGEAGMVPVVPPAPITSPILEPLRAKPHAQPASISPVAIDTNPLPTLPPPPRVPQMHVHQQAQAQKKGSALPWILGAAAVFVLVAVGGSIAGYMVVSKTHEPVAANTTPSSDRDPKTAEVDHANSSSVDTTPATGSQKADQAPGEMPSMNVGSLPTAPPKSGGAPAAAAPAPKPEPVAVTPAAPAKAAKAEPAPAPPPQPVAVAKPEPAKAAPAPAPKSQATTGVIKLAEGSKALTVIVDGGYHRVNDNGMAVVKCGHHSVRAGSSSAQDIDVPCGGMVTLQ